MRTKEEIMELWAEVKKNRKLLDECVRPHEFEPSVWLGAPGAGAVPSKYKCGKCGGEEDAIHVWWYKEGLKDASSS